MIALDQMVEVEAENKMQALAERAFARYGLGDLGLSLIATPGGVVALAQHDGQDGIHPYLGRLAGQRFALRIERDGAAGILGLEAEAGLLATLLRDTDLAVPEPVPACDGALVIQVSLDAEPAPASCMLFRWLD